MPKDKLDLLHPLHWNFNFYTTLVVLEGGAMYVTDDPDGILSLPDPKEWAVYSYDPEGECFRLRRDNR